METVSKNKIWYKIVDCEAGVYKTLFHGVKGNRKLKFNTWLEADIKEVSDGSSSTTYMSGWHVLPTYEECKEYLKRFKHIENKRIVKCHVSEIWPKEHSKANVFLAKYAYILEDVGNNGQKTS